MPRTSFAQRRLPLFVACVLAGVAGIALDRWFRSSPAVTAQADVDSADALLHGTLQIPQSYLTVMGIEVERATRGAVGADVLASAVMVAAPTAQAVVTARVAGTVVRVTKRLGEVVAAGESLAQLDSREAAAMAAELLGAEAHQQQLRAALKREQYLYDQHVTARQDLELAQSQMAAADAEVQRARTAVAGVRVAADGKSVALTSPVAGRLIAVAAVLGQSVQADEVLFRVADPSQLLIEAAVTAVDASRLQPGDSAQITTSSGKSWDATVRVVTAAVDGQTRTATVVLAPAVSAVLPLPGEYVQARIVPKSTTAVSVVVPEEAVQRLDEQDVVFVRTADGFKVAPVRAGARANQRVALLAGIEEGAVIATRDAFLLKAQLRNAAAEDAQ